MHIQIIQFQLSGQRPHRRRRPATAVSAWHTASGWHGLFQALPVDALGDADPARGAASLLRLAASALRERPDLNFEERTTTGWK